MSLKQAHRAEAKAVRVYNRMFPGASNRERNMLAARVDRAMQRRWDIEEAYVAAGKGRIAYEFAVINHVGVRTP